MRLVFFGDSLTWGGYGGSYVAEIQNHLPGHEIVNAGEGGNTVVNLLRRVDEVLALQPDGIFVMVGGNDAISNLYPDTRPYYRKSQQIAGGWVSPEAFTQSYRELLTGLQVQHVLAWVGLPPIEYSPELVAVLQDYNRRAAEVAHNLNVPVIDLMTPLLPDIIPEHPPLTLKDINQIGERIQSGWSDYEHDRQAGSYTFTFDGLHLMPDSARQIAAWIIPFLNLSD
ncbi:MAG: SGNH/GDSL hydrolase family protein [Anaerolineae bacterium]|nr:SGNH/GDSL hydrolase family protein [Anaerolineae bacterium]